MARLFAGIADSVGNNQPNRERGEYKLNAWKDLYYDYISYDKNLREQIKAYEKEIKRLQEEIKKNEEFFEKTFELPLDKCVEKSYNIYIKEREEK